MTSLYGVPKDTPTLGHLSFLCVAIKDTPTFPYMDLDPPTVEIK